MAKQFQSAKKKRMISNTVVHIILAILAVIWLFPIFWVVLTSFRAEKGSYVSTFLPKAFTLDNYTKLFSDTTILNFPKDVYEHIVYSNLFMYIVCILCTCSFILPFKNKV